MAKNTLIIPGIAETLETGVLAAAEGVCSITGDKLRLEFSLERRWQFTVDGRRAAALGRQEFYDEARAVIRGYLAAEGAAAGAAA